MKTKAILALCSIAALAACESGDVNITPTTVGGSSGSGGSTGGSGGSSNPCAAYTVDGVARQGNFDGTNCTYSSAFSSFANPVTVDLNIPFISGVHLFQDALVIGEDVDSGTAPAGGTGPSLIIDAGNTLAFSDAADFLLINRGSQIIAEGSRVAPITITSFTDAISGTVAPEAVQQWGGMQINGNGITNNCTDTQRTNNTCHVVAEGQPSHYGGNDNAESSGTLRYVVVKHTGFEAAPGDELNGITFNAVGSGTTVENIETYSTYDDGIEFFGGAVNVTNFVALFVNDDSIDFSDGYVGTVDNALVIHSETNGNRCVEGDNIGEGRADNGEALDTTPQTRATIRNLTCIISASESGTHDPSEGPTFRRGPQFIIENSIIFGGYAPDMDADADNECLEIDDDVTRNFAQAGDSVMTNSFIACADATKDSLENGDDISEWVLGANPSTNAADYSFNVGNQIVEAADLSMVTVLDSFYTVGCAEGDAGSSTAAACTFTDETGTALPDFVLDLANNDDDEIVGAVSRDNDWTLDWTYGLHQNRRGQDLWIGNPED